MEAATIAIIILLSIGFIQGIVYGTILLRSSRVNKSANRILAIILLLLSYRLWVQIMRLFGLGYYDGWYYIMLDLSWIHGALIYFYTRAQTLPQFKLQKKDWVHFIPLVLQIGFSIFVRLQNLYWDGTRESLSWLGYYGYVVWMNNSTIYIIASALIIYYAYLSIKALNSINERYEIIETKLNWIKRIVYSFLFYFSLVLIVLLVDLIIFKSWSEGSYFYFTRFYYYPFFIGIAILTYWIGLEGFSRRNDPEIAIKNNPSKEDLDRLKEISLRLKNAMEVEKLYKNPALSLSSLAEEIEIKPYLISKCLSEILNKRFSEFVNAYRVEEIQSLLKNPENSNFTLLSLAMDAGFNSKSSFNRAVKKHLGIAPSELKPKK